jgi:hypothetical protein
MTQDFVPPSATRLPHTLVWDVENTLTLELEGPIGFGEGTPVFHPDARRVLRDAQHRFRDNIVWTTFDAIGAFTALSYGGLNRYFSRIIGEGGVFDIEGGVLTTREPMEWTSLDGLKDLRNLPGGAEQHILIDDNPHYGFPLEAVVHLEKPFTATYTPDLVGAYQRAISLAQYGGRREHQDRLASREREVREQMQQSDRRSKFNIPKPPQ